MAIFSRAASGLILPERSGLSRRGFLRACGVTALSASVPLLSWRSTETLGASESPWDGPTLYLDQEMLDGTRQVFRCRVIDLPRPGIVTFERPYGRNADWSAAPPAAIRYKPVY
jgi:hypothetical protein